MLSTGQAQAQTKNLSERFDEGAMLPVHSALLTPGPVKARASHMPGLPAFFLVGDDVRSRSWLKQRLPTLQRLNAVGIVVQVSSTKALKDLRALAPGLTLSPASADDLAQRLGLKHYPVLISGSAIEQ
ncbi:integrating conjugative element protein [Pseudomonas huaxiensis]|uniref:integrating conjugative element protein n=1 Tax=Pseudomonas huaxiensis TaxID=2213017 RepID=UPI001CDC34C7|nr:integrating conjugative element protein [Pseudomonas huaxiensis]